MEDMCFKEKVVVVTGSTRGIGKEIAWVFARRGAVAIILGRSAASAHQTATEITREGFRAEGFACDVTNPAQAQEIINKILDKHGRVDILVNNAGMTKDNLLLRMGESDWDEVMNVNLRGTFNFTKAAAKAMLKAKSGKIINISSIIGMTGNAGQANYAASKSGIIGFTKSVARELASRGITANAVAPGYIQTDMTARIKDAVREEILRTIPLGRLGDAGDVASACLFLASENASYITGQTLVVDGGMAI